ncbi:MAG: hypothetical protein N7Q72_07450, partial [Spiroplasma sp. Tabriz.8]|nr:hypothetical protein [Spiroplasma sp. Tabriz.8]
NHFKYTEKKELILRIAAIFYLIIIIIIILFVIFSNKWYQSQLVINYNIFFVFFKMEKTSSISSVTMIKLT